MRLLFFGGLLLWLTACSDLEPLTFVAQPFPASAPDLVVFARRHQGVYASPSDTTYRLGIAAQVVWTEQLWSTQLARRQLDSVKIPAAGRKLNSWQLAANRRYRLRAATADSVWLDRWERDTLFAPTVMDSRLRWYRGAYYLNTAVEDGTYWEVQRFVLDGQRLSWQRLGNDSLRLAVLPSGVARRQTESDGSYWLLSPTTRKQERQLASYDGLWEPVRELERL